MNANETTLTADEARHIDQTCDRFETAWRDGTRPTIEAFIGSAVGQVRTALLKHLVALEWDFRRDAGLNPNEGDYRNRFSRDEAAIDGVIQEMTEHDINTRHGIETPWLGEPTDPTWENDAEIETGLARYELIAEVGSGGIGVVYRSRDRFLGRELAIKVLRENYRDQRDARRRFEAEARIGSRLQHPAIVPVYELGRFDDGRPYFTMKLIEGHTLAQLLKRRSEPGEDMPRLLSIFDQVCQAMAYAHANGVIHRDLKPDNVMVGAFGEVQVMDWGFAKTLDSKEENPPNASTVLRSQVMTHSGALMGTPAYMPPEQARGEIALVDTRSDVFALGAILCEILTGRPPNTGDSADEICRAAASGELGETHQRIDRCSAEPALRDLARRCLATDSLDRPAHAGIVAVELSTHRAATEQRLQQAELERAAANARAAEIAAKARAERRARRSLVALAIALLLGITVASWEAVAAIRAKHTAIAKETETQAVLDFVESRIFAAARPEGKSGGLGRDATLRLVVESALPTIEHSFVDQPLTEARLRMTIGTSFRFLGEPRLAADQFARARSLYEFHGGRDDARCLESIYCLTNCYVDLDRFPEALALCQDTLARRTTLLGPDHPDVFRSMACLAEIEAGLGRHAESLDLLQRTLALQQTALGPDHNDVLVTMNALGQVYSNNDRFDDALRMRRQVMDLSTAKLGAEHPDTLASAMNLANSLVDCKQFDAALDIDLDVLAKQRVRLGTNHPQTISTIYNIGNAYGWKKQYEEALKFHREALELQKAKYGPNDRHTLWSMWGVAAQLYALGRGAEAIPITDECVERASRLAVQPDLVGLVNRRSQYFEKAKDAAGCRQTAEMWEQLHRTDPKSLFNAACYRGVVAKVLRATNRPDDAVAEEDLAMAWLTKAVAAGYANADKLRNDGDLQSVRSRPDFQALADLVPPKK